MQQVVAKVESYLEALLPRVGFIMILASESPPDRPGCLTARNREFVQDARRPWAANITAG